MIKMIYRNKRNEHKYIELHISKCYHYTVKPYMEFSNGVKNLLGDRCFHRWNKNNLLVLLEDYEMVSSVNV